MTSTAFPVGGVIPAHSQRAVKNWLSIYSKLVVLAVLILIFFGALVTSNDAGLAVPDWPTTYGENMFLYSPSKWVGPIFYEHVHRLIASGIGLLTVALAIWLWLREPRPWVKMLAGVALFSVILQGLLGGLTVLMKLPDAVSVSHGMLAQTFFCMTIVLAYSQSQELRDRLIAKENSGDRRAFWGAVAVWGVIYLQLLIGAVMRHAGAGLAIPDFPTMGGSWLPRFDTEALSRINALRQSLQLAPSSLDQVLKHVVHRGWAVVVVLAVCLYWIRSIRISSDGKLRRLGSLLFLGLIAQFLLGVLTVLSVRQPYITSLHVMVGALMLGVSVLTVLRAYPIRRAPGVSQ